MLWVIRVTLSDWIPMSYHTFLYILPATFKGKLLKVGLQHRVHSSWVTQDETVACIISSKLNIQWLCLPVWECVPIVYYISDWNIKYMCLWFCELYYIVLEYWTFYNCEIYTGMCTVLGLYISWNFVLFSGCNKWNIQSSK